jgi:hypothetical protein
VVDGLFHLQALLACLGLSEPSNWQINTIKNYWKENKQKRLKIGKKKSKKCQKKDNLLD